ncbi:MAG: hypothetical protein GX600_01670 [Dehalococcoidia bacterium]|nr:hypothetical protein [Dehalococcoidia bacterium]
MLYAVCWGLIVLVIVAVMLHMEDRRDREKIAAVDRRIAALMDATRRGEEPPEPMQNRPDMTNPSRRHENGPQIAKSEGVQRGSHH